MIRNRIISFAVIFSLLLSLVLPASAHGHSCGGAASTPVDPDGNQTGYKQEAQDHGHDHGRHCHDAVEPHNHGDDRRDDRVEAPHDHTAGVNDLSPHAFCCNDGRQARRATVDVPTLAVSSHHITMLAMFSFVAAVMPADLLQQPVLRSPYKIGSSPPYLANISRHTYLQISILLI